MLAFWTITLASNSIIHKILKYQFPLPNLTHSSCDSTLCLAQLMIIIKMKLVCRIALFVLILTPTIKSTKFSRITWSSISLSIRTGIKVFEMHKMRSSYVTECASLCKGNGIYNCQLFALDQSLQCYLLKSDYSSTWPDLGFTNAKVFIRKGEMHIWNINPIEAAR